MLTNFLIYHLASGQACFSGAALILVAVALSYFFPRGRIKRWRNALVALGAILVAFSATPFSIGIYAVLAVLTCAWLLCERSPHISVRRRTVSQILVAAAWIVAVAIELPYHFQPVVRKLERPVLGVIGDSITAGLTENEAGTWPQRLVEQKKISVHDHSAAGATAGSARAQADEMTAKETLLLLEIGGNDLLGSTSPQEFRTSLNALLDDVCRPQRTVIMFELPLPPLYNAYGAVQRTLARSHGVHLIPKRILLSVLRADGTTVDSIHLSSFGQQRMSEVVWNAIGPAFGTP